VTDDHENVAVDADETEGHRQVDENVGLDADETEQQRQFDENVAVDPHQTERQRQVDELPHSSGRVHVIEQQSGATFDMGHITFPKVVKVRGRPKGSGKSLNRLRNKKHVKLNSQSNASDNCVECGLMTPPRSSNKRAKKAVQWVQCDQCDFWYHLACTSLTKMPTARQSFACTRCSQQQ